MISLLLLLQENRGWHPRFSHFKENRLSVHAGTEEPFRVTALRDFSPSEALYFFDTEPGGERTIGANLWSEYRLPEGYCDATACSPPLYALRMFCPRLLTDGKSCNEFVIFTSRILRYQSGVMASCK